MSDRLTLKYVGAAILMTACVGVSFPARAGFQWVAPNDPVSAPPMGTPQTGANGPAQAGPSFAAPASAPEIISPVVITGNAATSATSAPAMNVPVPVSAPAPAPLPPPSPAAVPAPAAPQDEAIVQGFARSVPLTVALRQILPAGYTFSIDQDVDMGALVSFQGGRPWRATLRDALDPIGLVMREHGQMIEVSAAAHAIAAPAPANEARQAAPAVPAYRAGMEPKSLAAMSPAPAPVLVPAAPAVSILPPATVVPIAAPASLPPAPAAPAMDNAPNISGVTDSWTAERGETLRKVLENWCRRSNVEFDWLSEYDYPLQASVAFSGGFEGAVRSLLSGFESAHPQPVAELHSNANLGQMVLVVQTRGNTNSD